MFLQNALFPRVGQPPMNIIDFGTSSLRVCFQSAAALLSEADLGLYLLGSEGELQLRTKLRMRGKHWVAPAARLVI